MSIQRYAPPLNDGFEVTIKHPKGKYVLFTDHEAELAEERAKAQNELAERDEKLKVAHLNELSKRCHEANAKWWQDPATGQPIKRNRAELLCLIHSEISEAMEGERKNLMDDKLPQYPMAQVELVDALIRIFDYLAGIHPDADIQAIFDAKMAFNATREDHKHEARQIAGGKQF